MNFLKGFTQLLSLNIATKSLFRENRIIAKNVPAEGSHQADAAAARTEKTEEKAKAAEVVRKKAAEDALKTAEGQALKTAHEKDRSKVQTKFTNLRIELQQAVVDGYTEAEDAKFMQALRQTTENLSKPEITSYEKNREPQLTGDAHAKEMSHCQKLDSSKVSGKTLATIAKANGMTTEQLITLNQSLNTSNQFVVEGLTKRGTPYCRAADTVYVYKPDYLKFATVGAEAVSTEKTPVVTQEHAQAMIGREETVGTKAKEERTADLSTHEAILLDAEQTRRAERQALRGTRLDRRHASVDLDSSMDLYHSPLLRTLFCGESNWNAWQEAWSTVRGREQVERCLNTRESFKIQGFHLQRYMSAINRKDNTNLKFRDLLEGVYGDKQSARQLVGSLAESMAKEEGATVDAKKAKALLKEFKGDYVKDYDLALEKTRVTVVDPVTIDGTDVVATLTHASPKNKNAKKVTIRIPVNQFANLPQDRYNFKNDGSMDAFQDGKWKKMNVGPTKQAVILFYANPIYFLPDGKLMMEGTDITGKMTGETEEKEAALQGLRQDFTEEHLMVRALETVYGDVSELYNLTGALKFEKGSADLSAQSLEERYKGAGPDASDFATQMEGAFATPRFLRRTAEYKGLLRLRDKDDQITYEDVESGQELTVRKEALFKYMSGEGVLNEMFSKFMSEEYTDTGALVRKFDAAGAKTYLNSLLRAALSKKGYDEAKVNEEMETLRIKDFKQELSKNQIDLLQEGYLLDTILTHGEEAREGKEAADKNRQTLLLQFPEGFGDAMIAKYKAVHGAESLRPEDEARIRDAVSVGLGLGFLKTTDKGAVITNEYYDAQGNLDHDDRHVVRERGTLDDFQLEQVAAAAKVIKIDGLGQDGKGSISIGLEGNYNLLDNHVDGIGAGARYGLAFDSGVVLSVDLGIHYDPSTGKKTPGVGAGIRIPLGQRANIDAHGHVYLGGAEVGAFISGNTESRVMRKTEKVLEKNGFAKIDGMLETSGQMPSKEIAEVILGNLEFAPLQLAQISKTLGGKGNGLIDSPDFQQFVVDIYRARKQEVTDEVQHDVARNPLSLSNMTVGVSFRLDGKGIPRPSFVFGTSIGSKRLTMRTTTGIDYGSLSDERLTQQLLDMPEMDITKEVAAGHLPRLTQDREGNAAVVTEGNSYQSMLVGQASLNTFNKTLHETGIHLSTAKIPDGTESRILVEMSLAEIYGNLEVVIDPALKDKVNLVYQIGTNEAKDRYFLAMKPGTPLTFRRSTLHYPVKKNGSFERTIISISENPLVDHDLLTDERAATLQKLEGKRTYRDAAHSGTQPENGNTLTLEEYLQQTKNIPVEQRPEWTDVASRDQLIGEFIRDTGTIDYVEKIDPKAKDALIAGAKEWMDRAQTDKAYTTFRTTFKDLSILGDHYDSVKLQTLAAAKGKEILQAKGINRELTDAELQLFVQTLTIYSFIDLHGNGDAAALEAQQKAYNKMLHGFMHDRMIQTFTKTNGKARGTEMANFVVKKMEGMTSTDFADSAGQALPEHGVFGSYTGTDKLVGIRVNEVYTDQDLYKILRPISFDIHSADSLERDVALAIINTLNPLPDSKNTVAFLRDDFTYRMSLAWVYKNKEQANVLHELVKLAGSNSTAMDKKLEDPTTKALYEEFKTFVTGARAIELAKEPMRIPLGNDLYLGFKNVQTQIFVFQRCGNISQYLAEDLTIETEDGRVIAVMDKSHVMVNPKGVEQQVKVAIGAGVKEKTLKARGKEKIHEGTIEEEAAPDQSGTATREALDTVHEEGDAATGGADDEIDGKRE